ncbi:MAG: hypothetical protein II800_00005 [Lachnospiraceae bacterium]|nr:hypothetical protein [Lachnospiraceae bacterium]
MDSKTVRLAVLLAITAISLILVTVYAVNDGGKKKHRTTDEPAITGSSLDAGTDGTDPAEDPLRKVTSSDFITYGEQIGDQPKAFMYDESFFDPMRDVVTGISEGNEITLTMSAQAVDDMIHVSVTNERGGLESGTAFQVIAEQAANGKEKTYTDTDRDGQIEFRVLASGTYRLRLLEAKGYQVPTTAVVVRVDVPVPETSAGSSSSGNSGSGGTGSTEEPAPGTGASGDAGASGTAEPSGGSSTGSSDSSGGTQGETGTGAPDNTPNGNSNSATEGAT